jgi:predicted esterase
LSGPSHGVAEPVAPIVFSSRVMAAELRKRDYSVQYPEFEGGHELPGDVVDHAMAWLVTTVPPGATRLSAPSPRTTHPP